MDKPTSGFLPQYRVICSKLKKRFLRKPNLSEASAQFGVLAKELENQECPHYAAFCCLAVARCENSMNNSINEYQNLLHAARLFLESEKQNHQLLCPSYSEHLVAALQAYNKGVNVLLRNGHFALAASLYLEIAQALQGLGRSRQGLLYYFKAARLYKSCPMDYLHTMQKASDCQLSLDDYSGALDTLTKMQVIAEKHGLKPNGTYTGCFAEVLNEVEISRVLLLIMFQLPSYKINPEHTKLLDRYADVESEPVDYINGDLYILLQSLKIAVEEKDQKSMLMLEREIWRCLSPGQVRILLELIKRHRRDSCLLPPACPPDMSDLKI